MTSSFYLARINASGEISYAFYVGCTGMGSGGYGKMGTGFENLVVWQKIQYKKYITLQKNKTTHCFNGLKHKKMYSTVKKTEKQQNNKKQHLKVWIGSVSTQNRSMPYHHISTAVPADW